MKLVLLGAPGAGKGTIAKLLSASGGAVQISTGDILRGAVEAGSALGKRAQAFMSRGELAPDELVMDIMESRLREPDCAGGFLLDGFPRTIPQARALQELFGKLGIALDLAVNIEAPREVILDRLSTRRTCENPDCQEIYNIKSKPPAVEGVCDKCGGAVVQREDETPDAIAHRLRTYAQKTAPLIDFYRQRGLLLTTRSTNADAIIAAITTHLAERGTE
ncbi:MAG: adenylate kinase [Gammaproteobacteria bacterium]|nr:adenylate kinase [Gammaproteobacteria bacterium]